MAVKVQLRRGTMSEWQAANPVLLSGEMGVELDTNRWKIGDGIQAWNDRPYADSLMNLPSDEVILTDVGGYYTANNVEAVFQEIGDVIHFPDYTFEPNGFSRSNKDTMGIIEYSLNGIDIYKVDQNSNFTKRSDSHFASSTSYEIPATAKTLVMYPAAGQSSFVVFEKGIKYSFSTLQSVTVSGSVNKSHFYFFDNGVLTHYDSIVGDMIAEKPIVMVIYSDEASGKVIVLGDERHGVQMDGSTHQYLHSTSGTRYKSGLGLVSGITELDTTYGGTASGVILDEDVTINIEAKTTNPFIYMVGDTWKITTPDDKFCIFNAGVAQYNRKIGTANYELTDIPQSQYAVMYFLATNDRQHQTVKVVGQHVFTTLTAARESAQTEPRDTALLGLPAAEFIFIGGLVVDHLGRAQTLENGDIFVDLRLANISAGTNTSSAVQAMAADTFYDNASSGLTASNAQAAIDELSLEKGEKATAVVSKTASYTLALIDIAIIQKCNSSSAMVITIPTNTSVAVPIGSEFSFLRYGTGTVNFAPESGVTLYSSDSKRFITKQYEMATLKKIDTNEWVLVGSLSAS